MNKKATIALAFDPENKSDYFEYMAKSLANNEYIAGNIVAQKPWYSPPYDYKYYIVENKYSEPGLCGSRAFTGFSITEVNPSTIEPYTQINQIKMHLKNNLIIDLVDRETRKTIKIIESENDIPFELWNV